MPGNDRTSDDASQSQYADSQGVPTIGETSQEAAELKIRRIGHFEIVTVLGQGAFGAVYHAKDPQLDREVAIKVPHTSHIATPEMRQRFLREARAAAGLRHPNICPVYEIGEENDAPYIVMAFIKGQELSAVLKRRGHFTDRKAAILVRRIALGLEFAHQQGIVHRDLKPENIMIDKERKEPVIMDFGLARRDSGDESQLTQEGQLMGTPVYMPPEQARGDIAQIGPASDVYSLGIILYELLSGSRPYGGSLAEVLSKVLTADAAPPSSHRPDISPRLETICMKAIQRDVDNRYASMLEFADELAEFLKSDNDSETTSEREPRRAQGEEEPTESAAYAQTLLVPVSSPLVPGQQDTQGTNRGVWGRYRFAISVVAAILLLFLVVARPWSGDALTENTVRSNTDDFSFRPDADGPSSRPNLIREFTGNSQEQCGAYLSPDNQWISLCTRRGSLLVWHRDGLEPRLDLQLGRGIKKFQQFTSDSQSLLVHSSLWVKLVSIPSGIEYDIALKGRPSPTNATISQAGNTYMNRVVDGMIVVSKRQASKRIMSTNIPKNEYLAVSAVLPESEVFVAVTVTGQIHFWDCAGHFQARKTSSLSGDSLAIAGSHDSQPTCLAWSFDETVCATADSNGDVVIWNVADRTEKRRLEAHPSTVHSIAVSGNGRFLLTGCGVVSKDATKPEELNDDYAIRLWDVGTGELLTVVGRHKDTVTCLSFGGTPDEAVSGSRDNTVCLWKLPIDIPASVTRSAVSDSSPDDQPNDATE